MGTTPQCGGLRHVQQRQRAIFGNPAYNRTVSVLLLNMASHIEARRPLMDSGLSCLYGYSWDILTSFS